MWALVSLTWSVFGLSSMCSGSRRHRHKAPQDEGDVSCLQALRPLPRRGPFWIFCANTCPSVISSALVLFIGAVNGLVWTLFPEFEGQSVGQILRRLTGSKGAASSHRHRSARPERAPPPQRASHSWCLLVASLCPTVCWTRGGQGASGEAGRRCEEELLACAFPLDRRRRRGSRHTVLPLLTVAPGAQPYRTATRT